MEHPRPAIGRKMAIIWATSLVAVACAAFFGTALSGFSLRPGNISDPAFRQYALISQMRIKLLTSIETEKSAVMSRSDEESQRYADQSRAAGDGVERDRKRLEALIINGRNEKEIALFRKFDASWKTLREIDAVILEASAQNTNLKAFELSDSIGSELLDRFEENLGRIVKKVTPATRSVEMDTLALRAETAVLKIARLQEHHILKPAEADKTAIESAMKVEAAKAATALKTLDSMTGKKSRGLFKEAESDFSEFMRVNEEIVRLSRLNTNNSAVELSLGKKRMAAMECDRTLKALLSLTGKEN
jgi:hypothetical protein